MTRVKICGITRLEDARLAASLGAWAVGFIFWPGSPRFIDPDAAAPIVNALSPLVVPVGVFVDQPIEVVNDVARQLRLGAVQLHGSESTDYLRAVATRTIKATSLDMRARTSGFRTWIPRASYCWTPRILYARGGTGRTIDWDRAATVAGTRDRAGGRHYAGQHRVGRQASSGLRPWMSRPGVEQAPGIKDPDRLRALFQALDGVEAAS